MTNEEAIKKFVEMSTGDKEQIKKGFLDGKAGFINAYIQAIELDPESPAVEAKRMLDDIMAFYCKDMYNP